MKVEYSDFLSIWKDFLKDAGSVFNVQMVAHHFYNLGLENQSKIKGKDFDEIIIDDSLNKQKPIAWMRRDGDRILRITPEPVRDTDEPLYVAPKPIPEDELWNIFKKQKNALDYARKIEEYHGIK